MSSKYRQRHSDLLTGGFVDYYELTLVLTPQLFVRVDLIIQIPGLSG